MNHETVIMPMGKYQLLQISIVAFLNYWGLTVMGMCKDLIAMSLRHDVAILAMHELKTAKSATSACFAL